MLSLAEWLQALGLERYVEVFERHHVDLAVLPAYGTLWTHLSEHNGSTEPTLAADNLDRVAERAVTGLVGTLPLRAGATAASTLVGGVWGLIISAGSTVWSITEHEQDRQALEPPQVVRLAEPGTDPGP